MKITVLYPWEGLLEIKGGAGLRIGLLIDYLRRRYDEIVVFSVVGDEVQIENTRYVFLEHQQQLDKQASTILTVANLAGLTSKIEKAGVPWRKELFSRDFYKAILRRLRLSFLKQKLIGLARLILGLDNEEIDLLMSFYRFRFSRVFKKAVEKLISESDVVFLEYPFWAKVVIPLCRKHGVPVILTTYDVFAATIAKSLIARRWILKLEVNALKAATYACCVSDEDRQFFSRHGVANVVSIINPIDVSNCHTADSTEIKSFMVKYEPLAQKKCVFVGSSHPPNLEAVEILEQVAAKLPSISFVIAGTCAEPGRNANVVKLGKISDSELRALYTIADLVVIPLGRGTGSSLKTVEALAFGKPILTTSVGARGYDIKSNVHGIVCDDFEDYPTIIKSLLTHDNRLEELSKNAKQLAVGYDYQTVYQKYLEILPIVRPDSRLTCSSPERV